MPEPFWEDGLRDDMPEIPLKIQYLPPPVANNGDSTIAVGSGPRLHPLGFPSAGTSTSCRCQVVRSLGRWSAGLKYPETSAYDAWVYAISRAERYIYVEQQYFISNMGEKGARNRIAEAILRRVEWAVDKSRPFRVYVVIPERPNSEAVSYFTRRTLLQDGSDNSGKKKLCLRSRISAVLRTAREGTHWHGSDADRVLSVCTLYSAGRSVSGRWDVGDVYVHSKVLVCDDNVAVIGSANVNDRSFSGDGDSELGVIIWDGESENQVTGAVRDFRLRLWRQYLGFQVDGSQDRKISDPSSDSAYGEWTRTSQKNLSLLTSVTNFTPRDTITSFRQWNSLLSKYDHKSPEKKSAALDRPERLVEMRGQLVKYPIMFLSDQRKRGIVEHFTTTSSLVKEYFL